MEGIRGNKRSSGSSNWRQKINSNDEKNIPQRRTARNSTFPKRENTTRRNGHFNRISSDFTDIEFLKKLINNNDHDHIVKFISNNIKKYEEIFNNNLGYELLTTITELVKLGCTSNLIEKKYYILETTINNNFIKLWNAAISTMVLETSHNYTWWKNIELDWQNLLTIFEHCLNLMPSKSWPILQGTLKLIQVNMTYIEDENDISYSKDFKEKLLHLTTKVDSIEKQKLEKNKKIVPKSEPEDDYRTISIFPLLNELVTPERNFVRKNLIIGPYKDISSYLDVQFRLLREDFVNPIRQDICDYLNKVDRRYFNIKIFESIKFISENINKDNVCYTLKIDSNKKLQSWLQNHNNKRLIHGTLLLFSSDNFQSMFCGQVVENESISQGILAVSFQDIVPDIGREYKMIECVVFFEPYYQVLKVLQMLPQDSLSMSRYIIDVNTSVNEPVYRNCKINFRSKYTHEYLELDEDEDFFFKNLHLFHGNTHLLNVIQKKALDAALNQEFVIIQGPPGTGKTFLGVEITMKFLSNNRHQGPILIVTYTNHALDQFLVELLPFTLVRLGSQSKESKLNNCNLYNKRRELEMIKRRKDKYYCSWRNNYRFYLKDIENDIKNYDTLVNHINLRFGIFHFNLIKEHVDLQDSSFNFFTDEDLLYWLLQDKTDDPENDLENISNFFFDYCCKVEHGEYKTTYCVSSDIYILNMFSLGHAISFIEKKITTDKKAFCNSEFTTDDSEYIQIKSDYEYNINVLKHDSEFISKKAGMLEALLFEKYDDQIINYTEIENPFDKNIYERWEIYFSWLTQAKLNIALKKETLIQKYRDFYSYYRKRDNEDTIEILKKMQIIGMTSTCAAKMHEVLEEVGCQIVIVEEAAEVLEAHILPVLTKHCRHVVLLGDHQQLKPSTSDYIINKDYKLGVSLFERMVNNNIECHTLSVQHRMRPEISALISPIIYPELQNNISVQEFPSVHGINRPVFFIDHDHPEENFGDSSKFNMFEARFLLNLAEYLIKVGYSASDITILAAYTGQVFTLHKEANNFSVSNEHITAVDNFQGEENKIILLSLVRNNLSQNVGFLSIDNRICVALSRAKYGLYIMGNMKQLCNANKIWKSVNETLITQESIGRRLPLQCIHECVTISIENPEDFQKVTEAGCGKDCERQLNCGHKCKQKCHLEDMMSHLKYRCPEPCLLPICNVPTHEELCTKACSEKCDTCCQEVTNNLLCGHEEKIKCFINKTRCENEILCNQEVNITLPCGHEQTVRCHMKNDLNNITCKYNKTIDLPCGHKIETSCKTSTNVKCSTPCDAILSCNHKCSLICHIDKDPEHKYYKCLQETMKANLKCSLLKEKHMSIVPCWKESEICIEKVTKIKKPCNHYYPAIECHVDVNSMLCKRPCKTILPCKHKCNNLCGVPCRRCKKEVAIHSPCGHWNKKQCGDKLVTCKKNCKKILACGHHCRETCSQPCSTICNSLCGKKLECEHTCYKRCSEPCVCKLSCNTRLI